MKKKRTDLVCVGGGSGGHVFPLLAAVGELRRMEGCGDLDIVWIGGKGIEKKIVSEAGIPFYSIPSGKLRRYFSLRNFIDLFKVFFGFLSSLRLLRRFRPRLLFSKGGYISVPPAMAARLLSVPVYTHESDFDPGLATRIIGRFADKIYIPYPESKRFYPAGWRGRIFVSGNPVRAAFASPEPPASGIRFPEGDPRKRLLVLGGSLGARAVNRLIERNLGSLLVRFRIIHQTGYAGSREERDSEAAENSSALDGYLRVPYINEELPGLLRSADLTVCRAGAGSLSENLAAGVPALLIPLSSAGSRGDQLRNAGFFEEQGCASVFRYDGGCGTEDPEDDERFLRSAVALAENGEARKRVMESPLRARVLGAADFIAREIQARIAPLEARPQQTPGQSE